MSPLLALILAAAPQALLGGSGASEEEAQKWLTAFQAGPMAEPAAQSIRFAQGFPQVVASEAIPGAPEGRFYALLGVCSASELRTRLPLLRAFSMAISSRAAKPDTAMACPSLGLKALEEAYVQKRTLTVSDYVLALYLAGGRVLGILTQQGKLIEVWSPPVIGVRKNAAVSCSPSLKKTERAVAPVEQSCTWSWRPNCQLTFSRVYALSILEGQIEARPSELAETAAHCAK